MLFLKILFVELIFIFVARQIFYIYLFNKSLKNIEEIEEKIKKITKVEDEKFLLLNKNYEVAKLYYIYFVNFVFLNRFIFKNKCVYNYYE